MGMGRENEKRHGSSNSILSIFFWFESVSKQWVFISNYRIVFNVIGIFEEAQK